VQLQRAASVSVISIHTPLLLQCSFWHPLIVIGIRTSYYLRMNENQKKRKKERKKEPAASIVSQYFPR